MLWGRGVWGPLLASPLSDVVRLRLQTLEAKNRDRQSMIIVNVFGLV